MPVSAVTAGGTPASREGSNNGLIGRGCRLPEGTDSLRPVGQHGEGGDLLSRYPPWWAPPQSGCPPRPPASCRTPAWPWRSPWRAAAEGHHRRADSRSALAPGPPAPGAGRAPPGRTPPRCSPAGGRAPAPAGDWARKESVITITRRPASPSRAARASGPSKNCGLELKLFHRASPVSSSTGLVWQRGESYTALFSLLFCTKNLLVFHQI